MPGRNDGTHGQLFFHDACMIWLHHGVCKNNQVFHDACMHAEICILACLMSMLLHQFMLAFSCTFIPLLCFYVSCPSGNNQAFMMHACMPGYVTPLRVCFACPYFWLMHASWLVVWKHCQHSCCSLLLWEWGEFMLRLTHARTQLFASCAHSIILQMLHSV
jgi:hypothetical protein